MSEIVDIRNKDFASFFTIVAITIAKAAGDPIKTPLEVSFVINGVELPFSETMNDVWKRANEQLDGDAKELAKEMVSDAGMDGIREAMEEAEWKIREALDKALN